MVKTSTGKMAIALAAAALLAAGLRAAHADDTYIGFNTNWSNSAAWSNNAPPQSTDNVLITPTVFGGTNTLTLDTFATVNNLFLGANGGGSAALNLQNNALFANSINIQSSGSITGAGTLQGTLNNAGLVTTNSIATLNLSGPSANSGVISVTAFGDLQVNGINGAGTLDNTGGTLSATGAFGTTSTTAALELSNLVVNGGNISATNPSAVIRFNNTISLNDVTLSGNTVATGAFTMKNSTLASGNFTASASTSIGGTITNNANWTSTGSTFVIAPTTLTGNGTIILNGVSWSGSLSSSLTIGANQTLRGNGVIGSNGQPFALNNSGAIVSDSPAGFTLSFSQNAPSTNNGTLAAVNGGRLLLSGSSSNTFLSNYNGALSATGTNSFNQSSNITLSGLSIAGGQLNTDANGVIAISGSPVSLTDLQVNGSLAIAAAATLTDVTLNGASNQTAAVTLAGTITNNGNWTQSGASQITVTGNALLSGHGTLFLSSPINGNVTGATLTVGANQTLSGSTNINNSLTLINNGNIIANKSTAFSIFAAGSTLSIPALVNAGNLSAANGVLSISGSSLTSSLLYNANGIISAAGLLPNSQTPAHVDISSIVISDGQLNTDATGIINLSAVSLSNVTTHGAISAGNASLLQNVTLNGTFNQTGSLTVTGTIVNNAAWTQTGSGLLTVSGSTFLNGNGTLSLGGASVNFTGNNPSLIIGPNQTVQGFGFISNIPITNFGSIIANSAGTLQLTSLAVNTGTLSATHGGVLNINGSGPVTNYGGLFSATGGASVGSLASTININNVTITGGSFTTDAVGSIHLFSSASLNDLSVNGNLFINSAGTLTNVSLAGNVTQTSSVTLAGAIANNANWITTGGFTETISGKVLLTGNGTLTLNGNFISSNNAASLAIGPNQTLLGRATVNAGSPLSFTNNGTIISNIPTSAFVINANVSGNISFPSLVNAGALAAANGGSLQISGLSASSFLLNSNGTISAAGSAANNTQQHSNASVTNITVYGGLLSTDATASITLNNVTLLNAQASGNFILNNTLSFQNVAFSGNISQPAGSNTATLNGSITNNALWNNAATISINGSQTLAGNGAIALTGGAINANLALTLPATQTIEGYGNIGNNGYGLGINNAGAIAAIPNPVGNTSVFSPLNFTLPGGFLSTNTGNISALGGGTLNLASSGSPATLDNTGGSISATGSGFGGSPFSHILIANLAITGGTLSTDASATIQFNANNTLADLAANGNLLASGTLTLRNVTLSSAFAQSAGATISLTGTLTNNANWTQTGPANINVAGAQTLAGHGSLTLNGGSIGYAPGAGLPTFGLLTVAGGSVIQGNGFLGENGMTALFNSGLIDSNAPFSPGITFDAPLTNNGDLSVEPNSSMTINAPFNTGIGVIHDNGLLTINAPVTGAINQFGNGTIVINPNYNTAQPALLATGSLQLNGPANSISAISGNGTLVVPAANTGLPRVISDGLRLNTLNISSFLAIRPNGTATGTTKLQHLLLAGAPGAWTGALDLTNNDLIVEITSPSTLPTLQDQLAFGALFQPATFHAGLFTSYPNMALALIDNSSLATPYTTFGGLPVDANSILIAPALPGDANLDGHVDLTDLSIILNNFGAATANWTSGNFDHAATIDLTDLSTVLNTFGLSNPKAFDLPTEQSPTSIPEPTSLALLLPVSALLLKRRPHK